MCQRLAQARMLQAASHVWQRLCWRAGQGIIRRVQEDGPNGGNVDLDILPRSVRYRLRDLMDDVRRPRCSPQGHCEQDVV